MKIAETQKMNLNNESRIFKIINTKNIKAIKRIITIILITLTFIVTGCYPILQSAELAPPKKFTHTIRTGALVDDFFLTDDIFPSGLGYHIAYGVNNKLEINGDIDLFWPRASLGIKTKLAEKFAVSANINALIFDEIFFYPDLSIIYGHKTYCGFRVNLLMFENNIAEISQVFVGKKVKVFNKFEIIPEIALSIDYINLGLGFEF